jgi:predicted amidohydrolase
MRIGAYQFSVSNNINHNVKIIEYAIKQAVSKKIKLLVFPECALTGYPPRDISSSSEVEFDKLNAVYDKLQTLSDIYNIFIIIGTIIKNKTHFYNSAMIFSPFSEKQMYNKRALWGWDRDNFAVGENAGIIEIEGWKIGVRICFEVRFPEFFRELYMEHTDLNIILFYDVSDYDDIERYQMIGAHIMTRAVENITYTLSVNTISPYQTAPTILYDKSGRKLQELERNKEDLLIYDLVKKEMDFGELGRKEVSDCLLTTSDFRFEY